MTKKEYEMLTTIHQYQDIVPNIRNNMDMEGYSSFRFDSLEVRGFLKEMSYCILACNMGGEDRKEWYLKFDKLEQQLKEFINIREKEQWKKSSANNYIYACSSW